MRRLGSSGPPSSRRTAIMGQVVALVGRFVAQWQRGTLLHEIKQVLVVFQIDQVPDVSRHFLGKQDLFDVVQRVGLQGDKLVYR